MYPVVALVALINKFRGLSTALARKLVALDATLPIPSKITEGTDSGCPCATSVLIHIDNRKRGRNDLKIANDRMIAS